MDDLAQWEYLTEFVAAVVDRESEAFIRKLGTYAGAIPQYAPEAMMPHLNRRGDDGWELVHMEPVADVGAKGDVHFTGGGTYKWSNRYFCVFKRRKRF